MSGSTSTTTTLDPQSVFVPHGAYICLITLELASIAIKYQGLSTNPFQEPQASMLLFLVATFCHVIALTAKIGLSTAILFHVSGVIACETLMWILVGEYLWYITITVIPLLVAALCFYYKHICEVLSDLIVAFFQWIVVVETCGTIRRRGLNADQMTDLEAQEAYTAKYWKLRTGDFSPCQASKGVFPFHASVGRRFGKQIK